MTPSPDSIVIITTSPHNPIPEGICILLFYHHVIPDKYLAQGITFPFAVVSFVAAFLAAIPLFPATLKFKLLLN